MYGSNAARANGVVIVSDRTNGRCHLVSPIKVVFERSSRSGLSKEAPDVPRSRYSGIYK